MTILQHRARHSIMIEQRPRKIVVMGWFGPMRCFPHQTAAALTLPHF